MTINTTRWSPDTCSCVVEYSWDSEAPPENRTHELTSIQKCPVHSSLSDSEAYAVLTEENPRKNNTLQSALDNGPTALYDINPDGARVLKQNITYNFSWSGTVPNRVLTISFTGINLTTQQKNAIQNFLNNKFGSGKVVIA
jgi:hypothetical protein